MTGYRIYRDGAMVGTVGPATAYPDTTTRAGTTYDYQVRAVDAAGNESGPSETRSVTTPVTAARSRPRPTRASSRRTPASNYGTSTTLRTDGGSDPDVETYLRFNVTGVTGPVTSAKLRLRTAHRHRRRAGRLRHRLDRARDAAHLEQPARAHERPRRRQGPHRLTRPGSSTTSRPWSPATAPTASCSPPGSSDGIDFRSREYSDATRRPELVLTF